jgi:hypothetical protein
MVLVPDLGPGVELASPMTSTFEPSKSAPAAFDEMRAADGSVRPAYVNGAPKK